MFQQSFKTKSQILDRFCLQNKSNLHFLCLGYVPDQENVVDEITSAEEDNDDVDVHVKANDKQQPGVNFTTILCRRFL